jgi:hypothetical protein
VRFDLRGAVAAMSVGALVFLALAVVVAVFGVLVPSSAVSISTAELERFPTWAFITQPPAMVRGGKNHAWADRLTQ